MKTTFCDFDIVDYLETPEDMHAYSQVCLEEDGVKGLQHALGMKTLELKPVVVSVYQFLPIHSSKLA